MQGKPSVGSHGQRSRDRGEEDTGERFRLVLPRACAVATCPPTPPPPVAHLQPITNYFPTASCATPSPIARVWHALCYPSARSPNRHWHGRARPAVARPIPDNPNVRRDKGGVMFR